ncbi:MAG: VTT domain-containing protein [Rhodobacteraceae bacterium]|nr:VTT domain-containing protein [Paracoccaceae bacterium]
MSGAAPTPDQPDGWAGILDPDEHIVWQGRPDTKVVIRPGNIFLTLFGALFAGFALFWMVLASGAGGGMWMFGLIHFSVGLALMGGALFGGAYKRRYTWYTLTNRRAFIARNLPVLPRSLKSYPITAETRLEYVDDTPGTIWFAQEYRRTKNGHTKHRMGFERIPNARDVYARMRAIQRGEA